MAQEVKYLSFSGLNYFWNDKVKPIILENEQITALALTDLNNKITTIGRDYLQLIGGTLTGPIAFNGSDTNRNVIRINSTTGDATKIGDYGYTLKFLGSGSGINNALALYADNQAATTQNLATKWLNDGTMYARSILPHINNTFVLGSSSLKWKNVYATTFTGNLTGNLTGNATSSTKTGDGTNILYAEKQNEINFGGTSNSGTIYFGYRATDSKPIPSKFVFGSSTGTAELLAKTYKRTDGTEVAYVSNSFITNRASVDNLTSTEITSYADLSTSTSGETAFKLLKTGSYQVQRSGSSELLINLSSNAQYSSTSALEFLSNYTHTSRLKVRKIIDSNRVSGAFKELAWYSDIPTKVSQLTNDAGYTTASGHTHSYLPLSGGTITGLLTIKRSPSAIQFNNSADTRLGYIGIHADDDPVAYKADGSTMRHILHSGNYSSYALPLSGGAMTGTINSQSIIPVRTHTTSDTAYSLGSSSKQFNTTYTRYVDTVSGYNLRLRSGGVEHLNMLDGNVNSTANIIPTSNNTYNLGNSSYKWKNVYSVNFIENGQYLSTKYADKAYADYCSSYLHSANRAQFCKPAGVTLEYSTDSGSTWLDYGATDEQKVGFFSGFSQVFYLGKKLSTKALASDMLRLTMDATAMGFYTSCKSLLINISTNGSSNFRVKVERSMKGSVDTFTTLIESQTLTGWSGWNRIPIGYSFGGDATQNYNIAKLRLTFMSDGAGSSYTSGAHACILDMEVLGSTYWGVPHTMAKTGHIYSWDYLGNAIFSKNITADKFIGNLTGSADSISSNGYLTTLEDLNNVPVVNQLRYNLYKNAEDTGLGFVGSDGFVLTTSWQDTKYASQLALDDNGYNIAYRYKSTTWSNWKKLAFADGTGATGTWPISITGNASSASNIYIKNSPNGGQFPLTFVSNTATGNQRLYVSTGKSLTFNPSTGNLVASTFSGSLISRDIRSLTGITSEFAEKAFSPFFSNVTMPSTDWWSGFTSKGWTNDYNSWQLVGISSQNDASTQDLYWRNGRNNTWNTWKKILDTSNTTYTASVTSGTTAAYQIGTLKIGDTDTILYGKNTTYSSLKNPYPIQIQANSTVLGTYDGSATTTVNITAANLGLSTVFDYKGITTTTLTDGSTSQTIKIDSRDYKAKTGDVVIVNGDTDKEYFWNGTKWEELGRTIDLSGYELIGHTHDYLPLIGGAMTGPITFNLTDADRNIIRINNGTGDATTTSNYGFTLKYLGSGSGDNNSLALFSDNSTATAQNKSFEIKQSGNIHTRNIIPLANNTYSLGNSSYKWSNIYATTFTGNLTGNASSATKLSNTTAIGSESEPVYFTANGVPALCSQAIKTAAIYDKAENRLKTAGWYRIASLNGYGTYLLSIAGSYHNVNSTAASFIINKSYTAVNIQQLSPASVASMITKVRLVNGETSGTIYVEVYNNYTGTSASEPFVYRITTLMSIYSAGTDVVMQDPVTVTHSLTVKQELTIATNAADLVPTHTHSASSITSGTLSVSRGGTGLSTITAGHVIIGNGTGTPTTAKIISLTNTEIDDMFKDEFGITF